jgi:hypothetical protein
MANPSSHSDDPERAARLRDDADEAHQAALDRADRQADYTPAPDPPPTPRRSSVAFLDAADRGTLIWNAADSKGALARGIGVALDDLLNIAVATSTTAPTTTTTRPPRRRSRTSPTPSCSAC